MSMKSKYHLVPTTELPLPILDLGVLWWYFGKWLSREAFRRAGKDARCQCLKSRKGSEREEGAWILRYVCWNNFKCALAWKSFFPNWFDSHDDACMQVPPVDFTFIDINQRKGLSEDTAWLAWFVFDSRFHFIIQPIFPPARSLATTPDPKRHEHGVCLEVAAAFRIGPANPTWSQGTIASSHRVVYFYIVCLNIGLLNLLFDLGIDEHASWY